MQDKEKLVQLSRIPLPDIISAQQRLAGHVMRTPLVPLNAQVEGKQIYLKLENLQPVHSFKLRGACNAIRQLPKDRLQQGVYTCSAGNFAQGLAYNALQMDIPCTVIMPDTAPQTKVEAVQRLKSDVVKVPYDVWWDTMLAQKYEGISGHFIHPVCDKAVIAGNATIGLEILEDLPDVNTIIAPFGGGGCVCGVASAVKARKEDIQVLACEVATAAPLTASLAAGKPSTVNNHRPSFVDGMGGKSLMSDMWNLIQGVVDGAVVVELEQICKALKLLLERNCILAEGAGAAPVAAAMSDEVPAGKIVCVVSGGNIDTDKLVTILQGKVPQV